MIAIDWFARFEAQALGVTLEGVTPGRRKSTEGLSPEAREAAERSRGRVHQLGAPIPPPWPEVGFARPGVTMKADAEGVERRGAPVRGLRAAPRGFFCEARPDARTSLPGATPPSPGTSNTRRITPSAPTAAQFESKPIPSTGSAYELGF